MPLNSSPYPKLDEATTPAEMRAAIEKATRGHVIAHNCLSYAHYQGMSEADTYVHLAYVALQAHADAVTRVLELAHRGPPPVIIVQKEPGNG